MAPSRHQEEAVLGAIEDRRNAVNEAVDEELPVETPPHLYEASRYLLDAGGKRLRPALLLLVGESLANVRPGDRDYRSFPTLDGEEIDLLKAAVSIEVIQSFTLIHDDIMDDDELRRGVPAVHEQFDTATAILAGDTLYSKAFEIMLETGAAPDRSLAALEVLAETCTQICEGQAMDIDFERRNDVTVPEYRRMIERKTAVLFSAAASIPAILMGADDDTVDALARYGLGVGEAFQIHDDVLDLIATSDELGKERGSDLQEGKRTLITIHAQQEGVDIANLVDRVRTDQQAIDEVVAELESVGSISFARGVARSLVDESADDLAALPDNEARRLLDSLAGYLVEREY